MNSDPIRLLDDPTAASGLRGDLQHATDVQLQGLDLTAGLTSLQAATITAAASSAGLSTMAKVGAKVGIGAVVAVGAVALWLGVRSPESSPEPAPVAVAIPAGPGAWAPQVPPVEAPPPEEPAEGAAHDTKTFVEPAPLAETDAAPVPVSSASALEGPALEGMALEVPALDGMEETAAKPGGEATSSGEPTARRRKAKISRADTTEPVKPTLDDSVLREARMVAKARSQLSRDPQRALALVQQAEKEFPYGQLVEERRAIAIQALVALGRKDEAHRQADAFLARYGRGAHAAAVRRALDGMK
ncbi:MAG: hypothetical protein AAGF11_18145 [Myxococcota bacterium]